MADNNRQQHWEEIYETKSPREVSWYQPTPEISLRFIRDLKISKEASIIDVGGGDSRLVDCLIDLGYEDVTVLDISEAALRRAKDRLGNRAEKVKWIHSDIVDFDHDQQYDLWHDRATFHFLTDEREVDRYIEIARSGVRDNGQMIIGTFSTEGPEQCSGLEVHQYSEESMTKRFQPYFETIHCKQVDHQTPFDTWQHFVFCSFRRKKGSDE